MKKAKYAYEEAVTVCMNSYNNGAKLITYEDLEKALKLPYSIQDKTRKSAVDSVLVRLKSIMAKDAGLTLRADKNHLGYNIVEVKNTNISKKKPVTVNCNNSTERKDYEYVSLSRNNQELYIELTRTQADYDCLESKYLKLQEKEAEYKNIINSLYKLLNM